MNLLLNVDSYKASHYLQYPPNTTRVSSYVESRGGDFDRTLFFGLQAFLKGYLCTPFSKSDIDEATELFAAHGLPFHRAGFEHILSAHGGYLPLSIQALPEGTVVPTHHALVQVQNTDPSAFWLTSYLETSLLRAVWYPTTVATISHHARKLIGRYLSETADTTDGLPFKLHDFGARGAPPDQPELLDRAEELSLHEKLAEILKYHVVQAEVTADKVLPGSVRTLNGASIETHVDGKKITVNDAAVTRTNIMARNGVIHAIDKVLTPPPAK